MAEQNFPDNTIYERDNLDVLRGMNSETVDLIATDPPFNTRQNRSGTAGHYVDNWKWGDTGKLPDQWAWNEVHPIWLDEIKDENRTLYEVIEATEHCHGQDIAAFLCFLSVRLLEMHRILKPAGSLYLHCNHTANAYIRMAIDAIFGAKNFRNEIVWCYIGPSNTPRWFPRKHDTIWFYAKSKETKFHGDNVRRTLQSFLRTSQRDPRSQNMGRHRKKEADSRKRNNTNRLVGRWIPVKIYLHTRVNLLAPQTRNPWPSTSASSGASSNEGDLVLDPLRRLRHHHHGRSEERAPLGRNRPAPRTPASTSSGRMEGIRAKDAEYIRNSPT